MIITVFLDNTWLPCVTLWFSTCYEIDKNNVIDICTGSYVQLTSEVLCEIFKELHICSANIHGVSVRRICTANNHDKIYTFKTFRN